MLMSQNYQDVKQTPSAWQCETHNHILCV